MKKIKTDRLLVLVTAVVLPVAMSAADDSTTRKKPGTNLESPDLSKADIYVFELMLRIFARFEDEIKNAQLENPDRAAPIRRQFAKDVSLPIDNFSNVARLASKTRESLAEIDRRGSAEAQLALESGRRPDHQKLTALEVSRVTQLTEALSSLKSTLSEPSYRALSHWYWDVFVKGVQTRPIR